MGDGAKQRNVVPNPQPLSPNPYPLFHSQLRAGTSGTGKLVRMSAP